MHKLGSFSFMICAWIFPFHPSDNMCVYNIHICACTHYIYDIHTIYIQYIYTHMHIIYIKHTYTLNIHIIYIIYILICILYTNMYVYTYMCIYMHTCIWICIGIDMGEGMHMCGAHRDQKMVLHPIEFRLQEVESHPTWVLGTKLSTYIRTVFSLKH